MEPEYDSLLPNPTLVKVNGQLKMLMRLLDHIGHTRNHECCVLVVQEHYDIEQQIKGGTFD